LGDAIVEAATQIMCATGDAPQLFGAAVVDAAARSLCGGVLDAATKPVVASFGDADAASLRWRGDVPDSPPIIPKTRLGHNPVKGYRRVGWGIREATYSGSG
jgi:hypothetical protein